jgi:predicted dehydrogenase
MTNPQKIRIAAIGLGNIFSTAHLPIIRHFGNEIVYALDPNEQACKKLKRFFPRVKFVSDIKDIPATDVDAAVIASPVALHAEQISWFIGHGIHTFCEKPMATSAAEVQAIQQLTAEKKVVLQLGFYRRFHPAFQEVARIIADQRYGPLKSVTFLGGHVDGRGGPASLMNYKLSGGGMLIDIGSHMIDRLVGWFPNLEWREYFDDDRGSGLEANALVRLSIATDHGSIPVSLITSKTIDLGYTTYLKFEQLTLGCELNVGHYLKIHEFSPI